MYFALGVFTFYVRDTHGSGIVAGTLNGTTFTANTPYHVAVVWGGATTVAVYVNGVSQTVTYSGQTTLAAGLLIKQILIGYDSPSVSRRWWNGSISNVSVYQTALSAGRVLAHYNAGVAVNYLVTGPTSGSVGVASSNFTITPSSAVTDSGTIGSSHGGDTLSATTYSLSASATPVDITLTAATLGPRTITMTSSGGLAIAGSPLTITATVPFAVTGPASVQAGVPSTFTATPSASTTDTITFTDFGAGGTFSPATIVCSGSSAVTTAYTTSTASPGPIVISGTSALGAIFTPANTTVYTAQVATYLSKWGKGFYQVARSTAIGGNNNLIPASISAVNTAATFEVNGVPIQVDAPTLIAGQQFLAYRPQCGGVDSIAMVNGGTASYTTPQFTATTLNGCTGLVLANSGVGTTASGILTYTITSAGSGYTTSFAVPVPGGTFSQQAWAWVNVVAGSVTSVVPLTGSQLSYGIGYTGTSITGIVLNGSQAFRAVSSWIISPVAGSGLIVTATIGHYVVPPAITSPGTGATAPVVFTITDTGGSGTGATCVAVMSGPAPTDTITYSMPTNALGVQVNSLFGSIPPAVNATVTNSRGSLEPGFIATPTMKAGVNLGLTPSYYANNVYFTAKNKLKAANPWVLGFNCTLGTLDSNFYPAFWTPNSWIQANFYSFVDQENAGSCAQYTGTWALQYDDDFYTTPALLHPSYAAIALIQGNAATLTPVDAAYTFTRPTCTATVSAGAVTSIAVNTGGSGIQGVLLTLTGGGGNNAAYVGVCSGGSLISCTKMCGGTAYSTAPVVTVTPITVSGSVVTALFNAQFNAPNTGGNLNLWLTLVSGADGTQHVHNPWVIAPGNTIDRSIPYATDDNVLANLTKNGQGAGVIRAMEALVGAFCSNMLNVSDIMNPNVYSWDLVYNWNGNVTPRPPHSPVFSGNTTAGSPTVTGIADTSTLAISNPVIGNGIPGGFQFGASTTILAIVDAHTITLSNNAMLTGVQQLSYNPTPSGIVTFNWARVYYTNPAQASLTYTPSGKIYSPENWAVSGPDGFGTYLDMTATTKGLNDNGAFMNEGVNNETVGIVEFRSNVPHGLVTGQIGLDGGAWKFAFAFTGTLTSGSAIITGMSPAFGGSVVVPGQIITGTGIPANTTVVTVISSTSITISKNATANGAQSLTATAAFNWSTTGLDAFTFTVGTMWVTGPTTVAAYVFITGAPGTGSFQTPVIPTLGGEQPIFLEYLLAAPTMYLPFEYVATLCKQLGSVFHLNLPYAASDAVIAQIATIVWQNYAANTDILLEQGNEHWNNAGGAQNEGRFETQLAYMATFYPNGTSLYPHYTPAGGTSSYITNGANPGGQAEYCLRAANKAYVFKQAWAAAGGNPANVKLMYGGNVTIGGDGLDPDMISAIKAYNLPQEYFTTHAYLESFGGTLGGVTLPAGYAGFATPGNWPAAAINDYSRHHLFYGSDYQANWATMAGQMAGTTLQLMAYEGAYDQIIGPVPFFDQVQQDLFYHESFRDLIYAGYLGGLQQGHPNVEGSQFQYVSYFSGWWNTSTGVVWKLADSVAQMVGSSLSNQFTTPQGGSPGNGNKWGYYQTNAPPALTGLNDFIGARNQPAAPPVVTSLNTSTGATAGGTGVTISGSGFTLATSVDFGSTAGTSLVVASDIAIAIVSPAGTGTVNVTVTTPNGTSATSSADLFTYTSSVSPRVVTGLNMTRGATAGGTSVRISGSGFTGATSVKFGTTAGTSLVVVSDTVITIVSPAHVAGLIDITVVTPNGTSATSPADRFQYTSATPSKKKWFTGMRRPTARLSV